MSGRRVRSLLADEDRRVGSLMGELDAPERVLVRGAMFVGV